MVTDDPETQEMVSFSEDRATPLASRKPPHIRRRRKKKEPPTVAIDSLRASAAIARNMPMPIVWSRNRMKMKKKNLHIIACCRL